MADMSTEPLDLDLILSTRLVEGVDALGQLTSDLGAVVEGTLELALTDGTVRLVTFDRPAAIPPVRVAT